MLVCDDQEIVREAVKRRIAEDKRLNVVAEAGDGEDAVKQAEKHEPDVAIVDVELPGADGIEATKAIRKASPGTKVIVLTAHGHSNLASLAMDAGAAGFVLKSAPADAINDAVVAVAAGKTVIDRGELEDADADLEKFLALSPREREVLELLATGLRAKDIADKLGLSPATVHTHVRNAIAKLDVATRTEAVALAVRFSYLGDSDRS